ncbi:MAG: replicative DNA helicase [Candidatus Eisenbacteria bacterium]|nr:replicative DNA helicase [Candidatus Eisenbacteria bacterium]
MTNTMQGPVGVSEALTPPQALDAERSVLAAMMLHQAAVGIAIEQTEASAFYRTSHQKIFEAIVALYNRNEQVDLITLAEELRRRGELDLVGGPAALSQLLEYATTTTNLEQHVAIVNQKAILRMLISASNEIQQECYSGLDETGEILDRAEQRVFAITDRRVRQGFYHVKDLLKPTFEHIQKLFERKVHVTGVPSGFDDIDKLTAGFQRGDLIIIAGRPSAGKTSLAINIAENAAIGHGVPVAIFSLEMSKEQLMQRLLSSQSNVGLHKLRNGFLSSEDWPRLTTGAGLLTRAPIMMDDSASLTVHEIRAKCRRLKSEGKLDLVVIDYLQLIRPSGQVENRVQEVAQITRGLKGLSKELDLPIIALSQLSRAVETRDKSGRPQLSDLRESGTIEQDSDVVMFVYREAMYKKDTAEPLKAEIIIAKQRNGPTGDVPLTFLRESTKFVPYSPIMPDESEPGF